MVVWPIQAVEDWQQAANPAPTDRANGEVGRPDPDSAAD